MTYRVIPFLIVIMLYFGCPRVVSRVGVDRPWSHQVKRELFFEDLRIHTDQSLVNCICGMVVRLQHPLVSF